ncbi:MAG: hypothetical protein GPJ51_01810 [Candidatus Heimdallarchaeota archaeon]|nr:hypothetical protein [Candidatus Heimdallarchaeota archaeon]
MKIPKKIWIPVTILLVSTAIVVPILVTQLKEKPVEPILITNNEEFLRYDFDGSGTVDDPFLIENLQISKGEFENQAGIQISFTTYYFIIRNCEIDGFYHGIYIDRVGSGTALIVNNTLKGTSLYGNGVHTHQTSSNVIQQNTIHEFFSGVSVYQSTHTIISDNTCFHNQDGIYLTGTQYVTIKNNNCSFNMWGYAEYLTSHSYVYNNWFEGWYFSQEPEFGSNGVAAQHVSCENITFTNNTCTAFPDGGIEVLSTHNSNFSYNTIYENQGMVEGLGSYFYNSDYNVFTYNLVTLSIEEGIIFQNSNNNTIHHNAFIDNGEGVEDHALEITSEYNVWYDTVLLAGNFWGGWDYNNPYPITGSSSTDLYPLSYNPLI